MRKLAQYADLASLDPDHLLACRIVSGFKDGQLKSKSLELTDPDTEAIQKKANDWMITQRKKQGTAHSSKDEAKTIETSASKQSNDKKAQAKGKGNKDGACSVCGSLKHKKSGCRHADTAHCTRCEKDGHFHHVCRSKPKNQDQKGSDKKNGSKGKGGKDSSSSNDKKPSQSGQGSPESQ